MSTNRPTTHAQSCRASALPPKERSTRITGTRTREGRERPEHAWAPTARTTRCARRGGSGGRRRGEAGPERGQGRAQGVFQVTAKLTDNGTGGEERRRGGATTNGGGGRRAAPTALQGGEGGLVRREITETNRVVERTT